MTRFSARLWLILGCGDRRSEMSSTAVRLPRVSKMGAAVQDRGVWVRSKWSLWWIVIASLVTMQDPTPQVPASSSDQSEPRYSPARRSSSSNFGSPK